MINKQINLTDAAVAASKTFLEKRGIPSAYMRVGVRGAGCSGFEYVIQFEDEKPTEKDIEFNFDGLKVLVDNKSINYISDIVIDWKTSLMKSEYVFLNPQEADKCGCGKSFSIK
jgi:iron-sulfur cluster assembly accessory protein